MEKLFLLDAYALIYRAYYALIRSPRINSKGLNTSAIFGFVNTLEEVLKKENPTHIGVAFDPKGPTFRHELYAPYKAQREETPEDIRRAVPIIKEIISAYRIPILEVPGYEADDVIGTLAKKADEKGLFCYMMTPDKDYAQLVSEHVHIYRPRLGDKPSEILTPERVCEKYELQSPLQVIDLLGLMGDSSDNIPGCPGVGEKTAKKLIHDFGSIESLLARTDELKGTLKEKVANNVEQIRLSRFLATIKRDVPIDLDLEALKRSEPDEEKLHALFAELEFRSMMNRSSSPTPSSQSSPKAKDEPKGETDLFSQSTSRSDGQLDLFASSSTDPSSSDGKNGKGVGEAENGEKLVAENSKITGGSTGDGFFRFSRAKKQRNTNRKSLKENMKGPKFCKKSVHLRCLHSV